MKIEKHNLALVTLIAVLVGCSESSNDDSDDVLPVSPSSGQPNNPSNDPAVADLPPEGSVEGVWRTRCFFNGDGSATEFQTVTYIREGADTAYVESFHADRFCMDAAQRSFYIRGSSEDIGSYLEPVFGREATTVLVTVDKVFINDFELQSTGSQSFIDLVYRDSETVVLGIQSTLDPDSGIPQQLNWSLPFRYVGPPVFPES